ncbi:AAA family ATPase [Sulfitobacter guttiformis]|uniref:Pilus assembly protein CpaE n=1 Tax=Sulfitobacter guttiformis TaxID=74349 RepID=A0A420DK53_9RHOB|nr:hypothetical protein [Sulfitobacter guttiformis]KIN71540.1 CpaE2 pilus assembly protein [Sulfitobacter guttiformis KCTC 32187]RKE94623.1 pilus assembly protein CpaE [Sulfitobacter guttiformis]
MPFDANVNHTTVHIAAYVCTDEGAAVARSVLETSVGDSDDLHGGGLSGAARVCTEENAPLIILAEIGHIPVEMACECVTEICRTGTDVIVLGAQSDITTYRALIKAGALEYFALPVTAEEILSVQRSVPASLVPEPAAAAPEFITKTMSIAVVGSNGGVGASLLAQNLGFHAAAAKGAALRTALIDADLRFGSQAIDLDREETVGLFEALMSPDRIDETFIAATMDHLNDRLSLYSHQVRIGQDARTYEAGLSGLYSPLCAEFDVVITDVTRDHLMQQPELARRFDVLVLVIPTGFSGVNAARRLIDALAAQAPDLRIIPVLSDLRKDAKLSQKDVAKTIGHAIAATLPRSDVPLMRAHRAARPLIEMQPRGAYAKSVAAIWAKASARPAPAAKSKRLPLLKRIFS